MNDPLDSQAGAGQHGDCHSGGYAGHPDQGFGGDTYAQFGEDLILMNIFKLLGIERPSYMDVGAHHPENISNTALFYRNGSRGVNIEANPNLLAAFIERRPEDLNLNIGISSAPGEMDFYMIDDYSGRNTFSREVAEDFVRAHPQFSISEVRKVRTYPISDVVNEWCGGVFPDFLSIDVEGLDYEILETIDYRKSKPKVICVEVETGGGLNNTNKIHSLLVECGYFQYVKTLGNGIYVSSRFRSLLRDE